MKRRLLPLLTLMLLLSACAPRPTDPDRPIRARVGREFTIVVESNPTTGSEWQLVEPLDESVVRFAEREYRPGWAARKGAVGAGGYDLWHFRAVGPGMATIVLGLYPPSGEETPSRTITFTVQVRR